VVVHTTLLFSSNKMSYVQLVYRELGNPLDVLKLEKVEGIPTAKENEVVVKVTYTPIHPVYNSIIAGKYLPVPSKVPGVPGIEGAGVVASIGSAVTKFKAGQRVILSAPSGVFSEYIVLNEDKVEDVHIPDDVPDAEISQWRINPGTAYGLLQVTTKIGPDDWVVSTAAGSTLGRLLIQIAKIKNITKVINIVRRPEQVQQLKDETGAEFVLQYESGDGAHLHEQIRKITGGKGVKYVFDAIRGDTSSVLYEAIVPEGEHIQYGNLSLTAYDDNKLKDKTNVRFFTLRDLAADPKAKEYFNEFIGWILTKKLVIPVEKVYSVHEWQAAWKHANSPGNHGKVVLKWD